MSLIRGSRCRCLLEADGGDGLVGLVVLVHQFERRGEPGGGDVLLPSVLVALGESLTQGGGFRRHDLSLPYQQIDGVRRVALVGEIVTVADGDRAQVGIAALDETCGDGFALRRGLDQEVLRIQRDELDDRVATRPELVGALVVLTHAQFVYQ